MNIHNDLEKAQSANFLEGSLMPTKNSKIYGSEIDSDDLSQEIKQKILNTEIGMMQPIDNICHTTQQKKERETHNTLNWKDNGSDVDVEGNKDSCKKNKSRKRFSAKEKRDIKEKINKLFKDGISPLIIQREVGISKTQMNGFLTELLLENRIDSNLIKMSNVYEFSNVSRAIKNYFPDIKPTDILNVKFEGSSISLTLV